MALLEEVAAGAGEGVAACRPAGGGGRGGDGELLVAQLPERVLAADAQHHLVDAQRHGVADDAGRLGQAQLAARECVLRPRDVIVDHVAHRRHQQDRHVRVRRRQPVEGRRDEVPEHGAHGGRVRVVGGIAGQVEVARGDQRVLDVDEGPGQDEGVDARVGRLAAERVQRLEVEVVVGRVGARGEEDGQGRRVRVRVHGVRAAPESLAVRRQHVRLRRRVGEQRDIQHLVHRELAAGAVDAPQGDDLAGEELVAPEPGQVQGHAQPAAGPPRRLQHQRRRVQPALGRIRRYAADGDDLGGPLAGGIPEGGVVQAVVLRDLADELVYPVVQGLGCLGQLHGERPVCQLLQVGHGGELDAGLGEGGDGRLGGAEVLVEDLEDVARAGPVAEG